MPARWGSDLRQQERSHCQLQPRPRELTHGRRLLHARRPAAGVRNDLPDADRLTASLEWTEGSDGGRPRRRKSSKDLGTAPGRVSAHVVGQYLVQLNQSSPARQPPPGGGREDHRADNCRGLCKDSHLESTAFEWCGSYPYRAGARRNCRCLLFSHRLSCLPRLE
jgi:hypothetical protein